MVFDKMREQQLYAKSSKCEFATTKIAYLGHIISQGVSVDSSKSDSVIQLAYTKDYQKSLGDFWGLLGITENL